MPTHEGDPVTAPAAPRKRRLAARGPKAAPPATAPERLASAPLSAAGLPPEVSVIIPAYNEAERIAPTVVAAHAYFSGRGVPYEIIVVDDASTDRTAEIVERLAADAPEVRLARQERNEGKGAAIARGMREARGAVRLFADADGATPFSEFEKLEAALQEGADIAFGSRAMPGSVLEPPQPPLRRLLGVGTRLVIQSTNLPWVRDSQCGFKAFTAEAADAIFPHLRTNRFGTDIEILVLARRLGLKAVEIGVLWRDQAGSTVGRSAYLQTLVEDLRIRYNAIKGAYPKR